MSPEQLDGAACVFIWVVVSLFMYFLPTIVALIASHPQKGAIFLLNFFAGWTFVGWVAAIVWAAIGKTPGVRSIL